MTTEAQQQEALKETKPKEERRFCICCRKIAKFTIEGCLRVCQACGSVGQLDK